MNALTLYLVLTLETFSLTLVLSLFRRQYAAEPALLWLNAGNLLAFVGLLLLLTRMFVPWPLLIFAANVVLFLAFVTYSQASFAFWGLNLSRVFVGLVASPLALIFFLFTFVWPVIWVRTAFFALGIAALYLVAAFPQVPDGTELTLRRLFLRFRWVYVISGLLFFSRGVLAFLQRPESLLSNGWASTSFLYFIIFTIFFNNLGFVYLVLTRRNLDLQTLNAANSQILKIVGHDLRGPLGSYEEYFDTLAHEACHDPEDFDAYIQLFRSSARQARSLVESLLEWRNLATGALEFTSQPLRLRETVEQVCDLMKLAADKKGVKLVGNLKAEAVLCSDPRAVQTIVRNLVSNALKFSKSGQKITFESFPEGDKVVLVIEDEAGGIPQHVLDQLEDNLHPISSPGTAGEKGSGFGLLLCRQWSALAGLAFRLENTGKGTRALLKGPKGVFA
ncbi:MAG: HAMP domain-containing histidine kinase [Spirochaetales bacterium]|nr:HAMP domain-containing histidine kinase [Spirochaetales bacterium]